MTLHSAKGLEFHTVFLAGMEEGLSPHSQSMNSIADLEEERRLCYVGITRAKRKLYLTWTPFRKSYGPEAGFPSQISRFLREMPRELLEGFETRDHEFADQRRRYRGSRFYDETESYETDSGHKRNQIRIREESPVRLKTIAELKAYLEEKKRSAAKAPEESSEARVFKAGTRVRHEQFGDGIVLSRERMGNETKLIITFSRVGKKSLIERYAKLKQI